MTLAGNSSLARKLYERETPIPGLQPLEEMPLLQRYLSRISARIESDGLTHLYWVTGIHTREITEALVEAIARRYQGQRPALVGDKNAIVVRPGEAQLVEPVATHLDCPVLLMQEFYTDSFAIINEAAVLDVTPVSTDDGVPEFNEDATVVSLYIGLFNMLKNRAVDNRAKAQARC